MQDQFFDKIRGPKLGLAASLKGKDIQSVRDFGGVWKINGLYLTDAVKALNPGWAEMVDNITTPEFDAERGKINDAGNTDIDYTKADFRELSKMEMQNTDLSLLYDVLLHQNNFDEVIRQVCKLTNKYICVAQPFYEGLNRPDSCSLIQFLTPEEKQGMGCEMWDTIDQPRTKFDVNVWMWAQSKRLIVDLFKGYGWTVVLGEHEFNFAMPPEHTKWIYSGMIFKKD